MARKAASFAIALVAGSVASAQVVLHGVRGNGDVIQIDPMTGAAMLLGSSGRVVQVGSSGSTSCGKWPWLLPLVVDESPPQPAFAWLSPCDGRTIQLEEWFNAPPGARVPAVAGDPDVFCAVGLYLVLETSGGGALGRMNLDHRVFTSIGPTGRNDLVALARSPAGELFALGADGGGGLYRLNPATGAATLVGPCPFGDAGSPAFLPDGTLLACGSHLPRIDPSIGEASTVGPTGVTDIRALSVTPGCVPPPMQCYPNCSGGRTRLRFST